MDNKKKASLESMIASMDDQYWFTLAELTNVMSENIDMLLSQQRKSFTELIVLYLQIAETKYTGYKSLLADHVSHNEALKIEADFKCKLSTLETERQEILVSIYESQTRMLESVKHSSGLFEKQRLIS